MEPDRFARIKDLFLRARALSEDERPAWLERECDGDRDLIREVEALLAHESQFVTTHGIAADDDGTARAAFGRRIHERAAAVGATARIGAGEAFKALTDL